MRDLINFIALMEANTFTSAANLNQNPKRFENLIKMIRTSAEIHFLDKKTGEKDTFVADPNEADRLQELYDSGKFTGSQNIRDIATGEMIPLSRILKTAELGGQAKKSGDDGEGEELGKEAALLKPSQIGITGFDISADELGDVIINNEVLQSTDYGRVVIEMAKQILRGEPAVIPKEVPAKITKSIVDYACEYLGVLALVNGRSNFPKKEEFENWLGSDASQLTINFPASANTGLADSFAEVKNLKTKHTVNISSKGTGGGAPPSLSGLKIPDEVKNNPDYEAVVKLIEICQSMGTIPQPFAVMNLLDEFAPDSIPNKFAKFLPWNVSEIANACSSSIKNFASRQPSSMEKYQELWDDIGFTKDSSDGGRLVYAVKVATMKAINEGKALPEFQDAVLYILDMNFVQQYADYQGKKSGIVQFETQWPAQLDGKVALMSKSGSGDPTKGGFNFKLSRTEPKTELEMPGEGPSPTKGSTEKDFVKKARDIALGVSADDDDDSEQKKFGNAGRKKR
jgi:hypothetical protein